MERRKDIISDDNYENPAYYMKENLYSRQDF